MDERRNRDWLIATGLGLTLACGLWAYGRQRRRATRSFSRQIVAITGGSRGLGLEMARLWAVEGAKVAICARTRSDLERAARELTAIGHDVLAIKCDITDRQQAEKFISHVVKAWGGIDVLVNNAGLIQAGPLECMTLDDFDRTMATHFWGPLYLIRAALPHLHASRAGRIVNIASIGGEVSVPHLVPYSASKFALVGLSDGLAAELHASDIRVTTVCPGLMRTGSPRNAWFKGRHRAEYAWFSISDSLPGISISSRRAARQIIEACRRGKPYLRVSLPARLGVPLRAIAPGLISTLLGWVSRFLPAADGTTLSHAGRDSYSKWSPSWLTRLTERAARRNNEIG
ncbi:MAG TPA: SDR family oxidoreductase [Pirellulales bacterium]|jgi:NAD(P)-dependent dehydrogenase (short-subunit alcohol dehydrogenase family)